jgi:hypothetical protein
VPKGWQVGFPSPGLVALRMASDEAKKLLLAILANGPVAKTEIEEAAKKVLLSERSTCSTTPSARLKNIITKKDAAHGGWT